jgi:cobalt/nickel transport system permease protein
MVPKWLIKNEDLTVGCSCNRIPIRKNGSFLDKTVDHINQFLAGQARLNQLANQNGLLQSLNPRLKLVIFLGLVVALSFTTKTVPLFVAYLAMAVLASYSKLNVWKLLRRVFLLGVLFSFFLVLPAAFNFFTPGPIFLSLLRLKASYHIGPLTLPNHIYISQTGIRLVIIFFLRSLDILTASSILVATTSARQLIDSLSSLKMLSFLATVLLLTYRYLFLLVRIVQDLHLARKSRTIKQQDYKEERFWVNGRIAWLLRRSINLSDQVAQAMTARGWQGQVKRLPASKLTVRDWQVLIVAVIGLTVYVALGVL